MLIPEGTNVKIIAVPGENIEDAHYLAAYNGKTGTVVEWHENDVYGVQVPGFSRVGYFYAHELQLVKPSVRGK